VQVGQTMSGKFLSLMTGKWGRNLTYSRQIQLLMFLVVRSVISSSKAVYIWALSL